MLEVDPLCVDVHRFRHLRDQARQAVEAGDPARAEVPLGRALGLWRGEPLAGVPGDWAARVRLVLRDDYLEAVGEQAEVWIRLGRHPELIGPVSELVEEHPSREDLAEKLMIAYYRSGRQADALRVYRRLRRHLAESLGLDPGPVIQELERRILQADPELAASPGVSRQFDPREPPNTLPPDNPEFTGREAEIAELIARLRTHPGRRGTGGLVVAIEGMPGVGKSTLAVHVAHQLGDSYPDARLHVDLRAHDPDHPPLTPMGVLGRLLRGMGVSAEHIPRGLDQRTALWRHLAAGLRGLVVLDDAADSGQVRCVLPPGPDCLVLVTGRRRLTDIPGMRPLPLGVMAEADAVALFARIVGTRARDAAAVAEVVRLVGHLPLAIQLVAGRFRHHPAWTTCDLAQRLTQTPDLLGEIREADRGLAAAFTLSYRGLDRGQRRTFRRLGLHLGPDFSVHAAAALAGLDPADTERDIEALLGDHLLEELASGRYRFHPLLYDYARRLARRDDHTTTGQAVGRLLDYYLHMTQAADRLLQPHRHRRHSPLPRPADPPKLITQPDAQAWLDTERTDLFGAIFRAAVHGFTAHAVGLAQAFAEYLEVFGHWDEATSAHRLAVELCHTSSDKPGQAQSLSDLGRICWRSGQFDQAQTHLEDALGIFRETRDRRGEADTLDTLGQICSHTGRYADALRLYSSALPIYLSLRCLWGQAEVLNHRGIAHWHLGDYDEGFRRMQQALALYRRTGDRRGKIKAINNLADMLERRGHYREALRHLQAAYNLSDDIVGTQAEGILLNNIATIRHREGDHDTALEHYTRALAIFRAIGDQRCQADTLTNLGATLHAIGRDDDALHHHQHALDTARAIDDPYVQTRALINLAATHHHTGHPDQALAGYQHALTLSRDPYEQARAHHGIGTTLADTDPTAARDHLHQALALFERLHVPEAASTRGRLHRLPSAGA